VRVAAVPTGREQLNRTRWRLLVACLAVIGAAIAVAGGSAGNRDGLATFEALPGPGAVSYGENIAYRSSFDNTNTTGSVFTQIRFVQTRPKGTIGTTTVMAANVVKTSCAATAWSIDTKNDTDPANDEFVCNVQQQLRPEDEPAKVVVVWSIPADIASPGGCQSCLKSEAKWLIKERKSTNGNETFLPVPVEVSASLLAGDGSNETLRAGGYELGACSGSSKSLSTNQAISLGNPVTSSFCLPLFATSGVNVGIATSITELDGNARRSEVCIAALGATCPGGAAMEFDSAITFEFRVWDAALPAGYKITQVVHNGQPLPRCDSPEAATSLEGCVVDIIAPKGNPKIWTIIVQAETNGPFTW